MLSGFIRQLSIKKKWRLGFSDGPKTTKEAMRRETTAKCRKLYYYNLKYTFFTAWWAMQKAQKNTEA